MKNLILLICLLAGVSLTSYAQVTPQGMKYQAVARDVDGNIMADKQIELSIALHLSGEQIANAYTEIHKVTTNQFGLFTVTIGEGEVLFGTYEEIPWESKDVFMAISLLDEQSGQFKLLSDSKLLAVPYAYHAYSADKLSGESSQRGADFGTPRDRVPWFIDGNKEIDDTQHVLGTMNLADLVIVSASRERLRINKEGDIKTSKSSDLYAQSNFYALRDVELNGQGGNTLVNGQLQVNKETMLMGNVVVENGSRVDITGPLNVDGQTTVNDAFLVENASPSHLTGDLQVDGTSNLGGELNVDGDLNVLNGSSTHLTGSLQVDGPSNLKQLAVDGPLSLTDSLTVLNGAPSNLTGSLNVGGLATLNNGVAVQGNLEVEHSSEEFIATYTNVNGEIGDGILISLGRTHPAWNGSQYAEANIPGFRFLDATVMNVKQLFKGLVEAPGQTFTAENFESIGLDLLAAFEQEIGAPLEEYGSLACNLTKDLIEDINTEIGLPWQFPGVTVPGVTVPENTFGVHPPIPLSQSTTIIQPYQALPAIPALTCPPPPNIGNWEVPYLTLTDANGSSMNNQNEFIRFADSEGMSLGSIRGESISEWCNRQLNLTYFLNVFNSFAGVTVIGFSPDDLAETAVKYGINGLAQLTTLADSYNSIGVEYSSGHGDYAEWLERIDHNERIRPGDIVGVVGGKITKDLQKAEQVMAISSKPIVLGNTPPEGMSPYGNKVAFMGQIPVKVMGPVNTGDYIVADEDVPGYGVAVNPDDMAIEDYARAVGRAWEASLAEGPKMVNTVVGVHNGLSLNVLKSYKEQLDNTDARVSVLEDKLDQILTSNSIQN